jgi:hypothetical protein
MELESPSYFVTTLLRALEHLQSSMVAPLTVEPATWLFARTFVGLGDPSEKPLSQFALRLDYGALQRSIFAAVIPEPLCKLIDQLRNEHEQRAILKEQAIAAGNFPLAASFRDEQEAIRAAIRRLLPKELHVEPKHLMASLRSLGYEGELPLVD